MKRLFVFLFALLLAGVAAAQQPDFPNIKNFLRHDENLCTGGQPPMEDLARMKEQGLKAVLNLRRDSEYDAAQEMAAVKKLGLKYFRVPVDGTAPNDKQADQILKILSRKRNRPLFFHCTTANRVGAFWMIYRVLRGGWSVEKAEEEARKVGLYSENLKKFALEYITRHQIK